MNKILLLQLNQILKNLMNLKLKTFKIYLLVTDLPGSGKTVLSKKLYDFLKKKKLRLEL